MNFKYISKPPTCAVVGVGFSGGQNKPGVEYGAAHIAETGIKNQLEELNWKVTVDTSLDETARLKPKSDPETKGCKNPLWVSKVNEELAGIVEKYAKEKKLVVTVGGDHSIAMGTVSGTGRVYPDLGVIWVDAHADLNTPGSTPSGNLHGCPLAFLMDLPGCKDMSQFAWLKKMLDANRLVYIGLRDIDPGERKTIRELGIKAFTMHEVDRYGIGGVMDRALEHLGDRPIHLSYDVDALDPSVVQATGTPVRGGLTFREGHFVCEVIAETGRLVAMDLVEVNPTLANGNELHLTQTVDTACSLARCALGETLI